MGIGGAKQRCTPALEKHRSQSTCALRRNWSRTMVAESQGEEVSRGVSLEYNKNEQIWYQWPIKLSAMCSRSATFFPFRSKASTIETSSRLLNSMQKVEEWLLYSFRFISSIYIKHMYSALQHSCAYMVQFNIRNQRLHAVVNTGGNKYLSY